MTWTFCKHNIKTLKSTKPNISLWKRRQSLEHQLFTQSINAARDALKLCVPWIYSHLFQNQMLHGNILLPSSFKVHVYDTLVSRYCVKHIYEVSYKIIIELHVIDCTALYIDYFVILFFLGLIS